SRPRAGCRPPPARAPAPRRVAGPPPRRRRSRRAPARRAGDALPDGLIPAATMPRTLAGLATPALCVDVDALGRNVARMADFFRGRPCALRPHVKAHKTPAIARLQAAAGCAGFTCATLAEAAVLARNGFDDLLIANEIVDATKLPALRRVAERVRL